jgi:hypothetical protein
MLFRLGQTLLLGFPILTGNLLSGAPISITNPGFDDISGELVQGEFTFGPLNGWDLYDPGNITAGGMGGTYYIGTLTPFELDPVGNPGVYEYFPNGADEGNRMGIAFNFDGSEDGGEYGMVQTLADTLQPSTQYTLQVRIGNITSGWNSNETQFFDLLGFPGYRVDLLAGSNVLASDNNTLDGLIPEGAWATSTVTYTSPGTVTPGQNLGIRLVNLNNGAGIPVNNDIEVDFDNVTLNATPIPEPGVFSLLLGLGGLVYVVWRKRQARA